MTRDFILRIRDVALCLLSATNYNVSLGRLEVQKIIYLADSMNVYLFVLAGSKGHRTYFHGPYDKNIQNALDALVIRDFSETQNLRIFDGNIACDYTLTEIGLAWTNSMKSQSKLISHRAEIIDAIMYSLIQRNLLSKVKQLVYAEPIYLEGKEHGHYFDLNIASNNTGHSYLALIENYIKCDQSQIDIGFATDMYIDYLSKREEILSSSAMGEYSDAIRN